MFAFCGEEGFEERRRLGFGEAGVDFGRVVAGRLAEDARSVFDAAAFRVAGPVIEPPDAGERDRGRAHRTGFQSYVKVAIDQTLAFQNRAGGADRQNFGMGRRVVKLTRTVARKHQNVARSGHDDRSDGHLAALGRRPRLIER